MNNTERRMWLLGLWTKNVVGIRRTNERRPYRTVDGKRTKSMGLVMLSDRGGFDHLCFNRGGINRRRDLELRRAMRLAVQS